MACQASWSVFARQRVTSSCIHQFTTYTVMRFADLASQSQTDRNPDSLIVKTQAAWRDWNRQQPISAVRGWCGQKPGSGVWILCVHPEYILAGPDACHVPRSLLPGLRAVWLLCVISCLPDWKGLVDCGIWMPLSWSDRQVRPSQDRGLEFIGTSGWSQKGGRCQRGDTTYAKTPIFNSERSLDPLKIRNVDISDSTESVSEKRIKTGENWVIRTRWSPESVHQFRRTQSGSEHQESVVSWDLFKPLNCSPEFG